MDVTALRSAFVAARFGDCGLLGQGAGQVVGLHVYTCMSPRLHHPHERPGEQKLDDLDAMVSAAEVTTDGMSAEIPEVGSAVEHSRLTHLMSYPGQ